MTKIKTRKYQPSDAKALVDIYYYTIHRINSQDYSKEQIDAWAPITSLKVDNWKTKWDDVPPIVALLDDIVVGFAEFEKNGHIDCFYVHHLYQGCGVGTALMRAIEELAYHYGCKKLYSEVSITAKPFFEKSGFACIREQMVLIGDVRLKNYLMEKT